MNVLVNVLGVAYGLLLVASTFIRSRVTEAMRVDALFMKATEQTRPLNLVVGLLVVGYAVYSLAG
jgi:hypothetical protein